MKQTFVGFGTMEDWLAAIDKFQPINANCIVDPGRSDSHGISVCTQAIEVSQVTARGEVLYCRVPVDRYHAMAGESRPAFEGERHFQRAEAAWALARTWLVENGCDVRKAVVATPRNLKRLDGYASFMRYDKASDTYVRVAEPEGAA